MNSEWERPVGITPRSSVPADDAGRNYVMQGLTRRDNWTPIILFSLRHTRAIFDVNTATFRIIKTSSCLGRLHYESWTNGATLCSMKENLFRAFSMLREESPSWFPTLKISCIA